MAMYMTRPPPVRSHQHTQLLQTEHFFQNGSLAWRYEDDDRSSIGSGDDENDDGVNSEDAPAYMDVGHFRWFWPWGVRRSSTFDTMPAGKQRLPFAATLAPSSITPQPPSCLLFRRLPPELRRTIFALALRTRCSARWTYSRRSPAWRPDRTGAPCIDAALLCTCRAAYAEAWDLPMRQTQAALADGTPRDKPGEWAPVVLSAGVLVPHAWQVLLLRRAEITCQHFRLEAGFLDLWVAALGKLKAAAAACVADLVAEETRPLNEDVLRVLREGQALEEMVVRMNRMDWWTWTSVPPPPWPETLPGECVADIRDAGRRKNRQQRRRRRLEQREQEEREAEMEQWVNKDADEEYASSGMVTDESSEDVDMQSHDGRSVDGDAEALSETSYNDVADSDHMSLSHESYEEEEIEPDQDDDEGGYFSDHTASDNSSTVYVFDAATLPTSLCLVPFETESWDRGAAYGVLSPHLRVTLMLETFGPKSLQLDAALAEVKTWRLPMPLMHDAGGGGDIKAGAAVEETGGRVLAWDGKPVREYHWRRDMSDEMEEAPFLRMSELKATADGVVVKMMTLVPRSM